MKSSAQAFIDIRSLEPRDLSKIPAFFAGLGEKSRYFYHPYDFDGDAVALIGGQLGRDDCFHLGAFESGDGQRRMVGHVWYMPSGQNEYPVLGIAVIDELQNARIGQKLMLRIEEEARARKVPGICLTCYPENLKALRVYVKRGYRIVGKNGRGHFQMERCFADDE
ncbi:MAG: hypothetical protein CMN58_06155 [Solibacterales bacterium]|uniref:N-acetyltransferase domain-containing protein n=1 Tax=Candidatus Moanibacter tarae TaxID=2200854 RepID=A0A2Z4ADZ6_9BACT|nr:MAG: hypothetical protein DF168_01537 [Candidatus Moanabacter tarae]MBG99910.1 hypothetical protein [Bryobacterales bacterium]|tara:strand:- start:195 stop:692 length:498 start_codon:yes stop_codon:yes gene_type:complete